MENFFNYISKQLDSEEVDKWFRSNNVIFERLELYSDFSHSLYQIMLETYLGFDDTNNETKITLSETDNTKHFDWCWTKTIKNFEKEGVSFEENGEHYTYFKSFFDDIYYNQKEPKIRESIGSFFNELFDVEKPFTKSDLDMMSQIYKVLDKSLKL